jgi:hypothetical protein
MKKHINISFVKNSMRVIAGLEDIKNEYIKNGDIEKWKEISERIDGAKLILKYYLSFYNSQETNG